MMVFKSIWETTACCQVLVESVEPRVSYADALMHRTLLAQPGTYILQRVPNHRTREGTTGSGTFWCAAVQNWSSSSNVNMLCRQHGFLPAHLMLLPRFDVNADGVLSWSEAGSEACPAWEEAVLFVPPQNQVHICARLNSLF